MTRAALYTSALIIAWGLVTGAESHDALPTAAKPQGWVYGFECCASFDCSQSAPAAISETPDGYGIKLTGKIIPYGDKKLKQSKDEFFHHCTKGGIPGGETICLYVPDRGM